MKIVLKAYKLLWNRQRMKDFLLWCYIMGPPCITVLSRSWLCLPFAVLALITPRASGAAVIIQTFQDTGGAETESGKKESVKNFLTALFYKCKQFYLLSRWLELFFAVKYAIFIIVPKFLFKGRLSQLNTTLDCQQTHMVVFRWTSNASHWPC